MSDGGLEVEVRGLEVEVRGLEGFERRPCESAYLFRIARANYVDFPFCKL
jgi:hypothetical protein